MLADEHQEEYDALEQGWRRYFQPVNYQEEKLLETLIRNDWLHRRAERRYLQAEANLTFRSGTEGGRWSIEDQQRLELMQHYTLSAERAFYRAWAALHRLR